MAKLAFIVFFFAILFSAFAVVFADSAMDFLGQDAGTTRMEKVMVPFHFAQIIISSIIAIYVFILIRSTGQLGTFIYLFIAMITFVVAAIISYLPHIGMMEDMPSQITRLVLTTIALALIGVTFNLSIRTS